MDAFEIADLLAEQKKSGAPYHEFLKVDALSTGLYFLPAGSTDPQHPHAEDEIYFVLDGTAKIRVLAEDRAVSPGSIVYVPAGAEHRFHAIEEDLTVLVFFAPSEGSAIAEELDL